MPDSTSLILAAGAITAANELLFTPIAEGKAPVWSSFNWRIVPATAIAAVLLKGIDLLSPAFATGLGATALITVVFAKLGNAPAPAENLDKILGYAGKVT